MKRPITVIVAAAASLAFAATALADNYFARDGQGQLLTFASKVINGTNYQIHLLYGLNGGAAVPVALDPSGNVGVNVISGGAPSYAASGATPVTGPFSATGQSAAFTPLNYGRPENVAFSGTGTFSIQLERKFAGDANWYPLSAMTGQRYTWTTTGTQTVTVSDFLNETENGVTLRWNITACSSCSGTYRISQ